MSKVSIVIPTYNVQSYIAKCLQSCINQSLSDIEILVIDDCGQDNSISIAKEFAKKDRRIKIIHNKENLGTFNTRLKGIQEASGEYILFLDADDYLQKDACKIAYNKALQTAKTKQNTKSLDSLSGLQDELQEKDLPDIIHFRAYYPICSNAKIIENLKHKLRYILPTRFSPKPLQGVQIAYNFFLKSKNFPKFTLWDKCYKTTLTKQAALFCKILTARLRWLKIC